MQELQKNAYGAEQRKGKGGEYAWGENIIIFGVIAMAIR
jgi:hypothetical protein